MINVEEGVDVVGMERVCEMPHAGVCSYRSAYIRLRPSAKTLVSPGICTRQNHTYIQKNTNFVECGVGLV